MLVHPHIVLLPPPLPAAALRALVGGWATHTLEAAAKGGPSLGPLAVGCCSQGWNRNLCRGCEDLEGGLDRVFEN